MKKTKSRTWQIQKQLQSITNTQVKESYLIVNASLIYLAMLITVFLLFDDTKESNLYKVGHDRMRE